MIADNGWIAAGSNWPGVSARLVVHAPDGNLRKCLLHVWNNHCKSRQPILVADGERSCASMMQWSIDIKYLAARYSSCHQVGTGVGLSVRYDGSDDVVDFLVSHIL